MRNIPSEPQNFTVIFAENSRVELSWSSSENNSGFSILYYELSGNDGITWIRAESNSWHCFEDLTRGIEYFLTKSSECHGDSLEVMITVTS